MESTTTHSPDVLSVIDVVVASAHGAVDQEIAPDGGIILHRTPRSAREHLADPGLDFMSAIPSGVRLRLRTDAPWIEVDMALTRLAFPGHADDGTVVDIVVDGSLHDPVTTRDETLVEVDPATGVPTYRPSGPATIRVDLGAVRHEHTVELWLPHSSTTSLLGARIPVDHRIEPAPDKGPRWAHHGSSISQCSEADRPTGTWPAIVARETGHNLVNLGIGGQCQLDPFMARLIRDTPADVISLELGINVVNLDSMRERVFVPALHGFLDTIRDGHPHTPLFIVSPIPCPIAEDSPGPTVANAEGRLCTVTRPDALVPGALTLARVRELIHHHIRRRIEAGDPHLHLVDGRDLMTPDEATSLPDGLHPDADGYRRMAERFRTRAFN